jgi:hypothetical protein
MFRTSLLAAAALLALQLPVASQHAPLPADPSDLRALWSDPAIRDFVGIAENGWDFTKPDTIPGFSSVPSTTESRPAAQN